MIAELDRRLKENTVSIGNRKRPGIPLVEAGLGGKEKLLRQAGRGKRPNKTRNLRKEEEEVLWKERKFGRTTPEALVNTM